MQVKNKLWAFENQVEFKIDQEDVHISFRKAFDLKGTQTISDYFELRFGVKLYQIGKGKPLKQN